MILISCPWCGPRDETEYAYGGQAHVAYPENPDALSDEEWARYLFYRANPRGVSAERWAHSIGCRRWFNVLRDTLTYEILAVYRLDEPRPGPARLSAAGAPAFEATGSVATGSDSTESDSTGAQR